MSVHIIGQVVISYFRSLPYAEDIRADRPSDKENGTETQVESCNILNSNKQTHTNNSKHSVKLLHETVLFCAKEKNGFRRLLECVT